MGLSSSTRQAHQAASPAWVYYKPQANVKKLDIDTLKKKKKYGNEEK